MSDLLNNFTDDEVEKYNAAARIKQAGLDVKTLKNKKSVYNPETKTHDILTQMSSGGYVKIGEESLDLEATRPGSILLNGMEYGRETPEYQRYYPDPEPQPNVMTVSPSIGQIEEAETAPLVSEQSRIESAKDYAEFLNTRGGATAQDLLAAGYTPEIVNTVMGGTTQDNMPNEVIRTEPLSTEEVEDIIRSGGSVIGEYDPTLRETGKVELTQYLLELAENSLAEDLRTELLERGSIETDGRLIQPLSTEQINQYIQTELEAQRPRLINEADALSGMFFGSPSSLGIGVGDFVTAGIMDIQEGSRLFAQGQAGDSVADRAFGALLVVAGLAEATGVGMLVGKAIKKSIPTLRAGLADVSERLNQPGEMPTVGSNFGNVDALRREANIQRFGYDPNDPVAKVEAPTENKPGIIAFHGSGADFNEFKLEEIGTGEGAQAFGYGLYFTDKEEIAKFYRDAVGAGNEVTYKGRVIKDLDEDYAEENNIAHMVGQQNTIKDKKRVVENEIARTRRSLSGIEQSIKDFNENPKVYPLKFSGMEISMDVAEGQRDFLQRRLDAALEVEKNIDKIETKPTGKMYEVSLNIKDNELLDYDGAFKDQSPFAQQAILNSLNEITIDDAVNLGVDIFSSRYDGNESMAIEEAKQIMLDNFTVVRFLNDWSVLRGAENSGEELLQKYGVKGIKYKANRGVGARNVPETGAQNYVIFDDKLIDIIKKYGIVAPVAVTAMAAKKDEKET